MMLLTLEKYFLDHGELVLPNIGQLRLNQIDAKNADRQFQPPVENIVFESIQSFKTKPSKLFYLYLSDHLDCTIEQAVIEYDTFLNEQLNTSNKIDLGSLGQLISEENTYQFYSNFNGGDFYKPITVDKVLRVDQHEHFTNENHNQWWILPLIIATTALLAILLK